MIMANNISLEFANGRIKSLERNLLTADKITRMIDSVDLTEAVRILAEVNYGGGLVLDDPRLFDKLLSQEEAEVCKLVLTLVPDGYGMECFILANDYHNAKSLYKAKITGVSNKDALKPYGILGDISAIVSGGDYSSLPLPMQSAFLELDTLALNGELSPRTIDVSLDKAYFADVFQRLNSSKKTVITDYFKLLADNTNIRTMARCKKCGLPKKEFENAIVSGGKLGVDKLLELFDVSDQEAYEKMRYGDYSKAFELLTHENTSLVDFEKYSDSQLIKLFKSQKADMFSPAPVAGYYVGKMSEIKTVRLILVCVLNGVAKEEIYRRLKENYA